MSRNRRNDTNSLKISLAVIFTLQKVVGPTIGGYVTVSVRPLGTGLGNIHFVICTFAVYVVNNLKIFFNLLDTLGGYICIT